MEAIRNARVRYREEFELQCPSCGEWWAVSTDFWIPVHGLQRCRACILEIRKGRDSVYYQENAPRIRARSAELRAKDRRRKQLARMDPVLGAQVRQREREAQRRWYQADPERGRTRVREAYARGLGRPLRPGIGRPRTEVAA